MILWLKHHRKFLYAGILSLVIIVAPATIVSVGIIDSAVEIAEGDLKYFENEISLYDINNAPKTAKNNDLFNFIYFQKLALVNNSNIEIPTPPPEV